MRLLIAPDKFKGSLSAQEVAENIALGLRDVLPEAKIDIVPLADGGEGTAEVICHALGGAWMECGAHDALGREIEARYAWIGERRLAVMEMSEASGMWRVQGDKYDVVLANTFGVGEMILHAANNGAREIIIGLGGSATNDGGFGMARALGFRFYKNTTQLNGRVGELVGLTHIEKPTNLLVPKIIAAVDVKNPLLGENGATRIFGPQKGVTPDKIDIFEKALTRLADVVARDLHVDVRNQGGAGAAGGLGFGVMSFCGATIQTGFDVVAEAVGLEEKMTDADLVITGEGSLDRQTLEGKAPAGVARIARKLGKRVFAIVGRASDDRETREIFDGVYELGGTVLEAPQLLRNRARKLAGKL